MKIYKKVEKYEDKRKIHHTKCIKESEKYMVLRVFKRHCGCVKRGESRESRIPGGENCLYTGYFSGCPLDFTPWRKQCTIRPPFNGRDK